MSTQQEREELHSKWLDLITETAGGNQDAAQYLYTLGMIVRIIDDVYDEDQPVTKDDLMITFERLFIELPNNKFYREYEYILLSQHISMWNAWKSANSHEHGDMTDQIYAHVWRDNYIEVYPIVAMLTQGHAAMDRISEQVRSIYKKKLGQ